MNPLVHYCLYGAAEARSGVHELQPAVIDAVFRRTKASARPAQSRRERSGPSECVGEAPVLRLQIGEPADGSPHPPPNTPFAARSVSAA
jgi:hypothetical protein